jgi:hypothetical protein
MKQLLVLCSIAITNAIFSQGITLTSIDFANGGDTVRTSLATDNGNDYSATGAAYTWDFSMLTANSQKLRNFSPMTEAPLFVQFLFGFSAPNQYRASYFIESTDLPISQITSILPITIENIYQYSKVMTDSITSVGYSMKVTLNGSTVDLPIKSDTIETRYNLPLNYGDSHFSRGFSKIDFNPLYNAIWNQHRTRTTTVDGYGSLITPNGTFDVLRVKHDITETDSIYTELPFIGGTWIPLDLPLVHEYEWWANAEKLPVLKYTTNEVLGNEVVTAVEYRDQYLGLDAGIEELGIEMNMYPNPVKDVLHIQADLQVSQIDVTDQLGNIVSSQELIPANELFLDVSKLAAGTYIVNVYAGSIKATQLFVKQ